MLDELVGRAVDEDGDAIEPLLDVAAHEPERLAPHLRRLLDAEVYWPQALYRGADEQFQRELIARVDGGAGKELYPLLLILAQIRGPLTEAAFRRWTAEQPPDAGLLSHPVGIFTQMGGWEIEGDRIRELCGPDAYDLVLAPGGQGPADERCPWCESPLWTVLDVDTADPGVSAALAHTGWEGRLRVITCFLCSCYGTTFADVTPTGEAVWSAHNKRPDSTGTEPETPPALRFAVGEHRASPFTASAWEAGGSTLGGHPDWIQDPEYPDCSACGQVMDYIGLVGGPDIGELFEGANYLFLHAPCNLAAVVYQQS